jgi:3D (Asp-Asp-Asp) domain-containing protein
MDFSNKRDMGKAGDSQQEQRRVERPLLFTHPCQQKKKKGFLFTCAFLFLGITILVPFYQYPVYAASSNAQDATPTTTTGTHERITVSLQAYAYPDNTDGGQVMSNTAVIAYPKSEGYPTLHEQATEGTGTSDDPITFAAYEPLTEGNQAVFSPGTKIYVEALRKYFIMEDTCNDCKSGSNGTTYTIRLWLGPSQQVANNEAQSIENCVQKIAQNTSGIVLDPSSDNPVEKTPLYSNGTCTAKIFTNQTSNPGGDQTPTAEATQEETPTTGPIQDEDTPTAEPEETPTTVPPQEWTPPAQGTPIAQTQGTPGVHPRRTPTAHTQGTPGVHPRRTPTAQPTEQSGTPTAQPTQQGSSGNEKNVQVATTSFGFPDNDDGSGHYGTAVIAFPKSDGYPTIHNQATEGTGTYNDPITFAAYIGDTEGDNATFPPGTRIYVPFLHKYFILEDQCAGCNNVKNGNAYHIDLWLGPSQPGANDTEQSIVSCEGQITHDSVTIIMNPTTTHPVDTTPIYKNGQCTVKQYTQ